LAKVVRAFSLDPAVSEDLDFHTTVPGKMKAMNKSKYVNEALRFYMGKNIKNMVEENRTLRENLTGGLRNKDVIIQGLKHQLDELENAKALSDCRCLWCRLKKRLKKSQAEQ
tara:strand:- start:839 stop:1174 length:336 start_codon:yes stop_codon:yes gene_type:complete